ncbi:uncharacterized protein [Porites lutea]|uniref:uncharacterized protein isoform X1 n=2 Tax=Porites lutea TaxID=51062 RepID=UPI003CC6DC14
MLKLQSELDKFKQVFKSSKESQNWIKSEQVCRCSDQEFDDLLSSLTAVELEATTLILQRHIDLEQQIWKCLDNLKTVQSGWEGKTIDVTEKLIASQTKVARLRSRLLRCITQQLHKNGSMTVNLPAWSGIDVDNKQKMENPLETEKTEQDINTNDQPGPAKENPVESTKREFVEPEDLTYSNVGEVQELKAAQSNRVPQDHSVSPHKEEPVTMESGDKESNVYETVSLEQTGPSQLVPPTKPIPYSLSKKLNSTSGGDGSVGQTEKDEKSTADVEQVDVEDAWVVENHHIQDWDPTPVLEELFGNVHPLPTPFVPTTEPKVDNIRMAGYMEKLPVKSNQKKGILIRSWKKRHFKAVKGKLYYYEDHRVLEPLGFINLTNCSVKVEDKLLDVAEEGVKGKSVKLRCASVKEAEDWKEALEAESAASVDSSTVPEESSATEGLTIIIDLGSSSVKAGFAQENAWPQVIFPCVIAMDKENPENCKYGHGALLPETRKTSSLRFPLRKSLKIDKLKVHTMDLIGILEHLFDKLKVDPTKHKVIMTLPHGSGPQEKEELVEILLDHFQVEACYLQEQAVLAMYSYSAISGIVVDIGDHIDVIPVVEGCMIESGTTRLPYGGKQITDSFTRLLTEKGVRFFSEVESYISRAIKEKVSFVARQVDQEEEEADCSMVVDLGKYSIPDGTREVTVDSARHRCTEGLFKPSVWGKDNPGIHELTVKAIMACSIDMRKQMCRNIYLSGGGSMSPGLAERLQAEVSQLTPVNSHVQVHAGVERQYAAYIGASVVAKLPLFTELCVFKEDWDEIGPDALEKWLTL